MWRCTCCRLWTVEPIYRDGRQRLRIRCAGSIIRDCDTILDVQRWMPDERYAHLEYEPEDSCE